MFFIKEDRDCTDDPLIPYMEDQWLIKRFHRARLLDTIPRVVGPWDFQKEPFKDLQHVFSNRVALPMRDQVLWPEGK